MAEKETPNGTRATDIRPVPDPTVLTTQQLVREIAALREIVEAQIVGQKTYFESRLDGMDKAIGLLQAITNRQPADVDGKIHNLQVLHQEKFDSIQTQFRERDTRGEQTQRDSKVAVDAALQAAKEAVGEQNKSSALAIAKSEAATTKQIDQLGSLVNTTNAGLDGKITDVKERLTRLESEDRGARGAKEDTKSLVAIAISVLTAVALLWTTFAPHQTAPIVTTPAPTLAVPPGYQLVPATTK